MSRRPKRVWFPRAPGDGPTTATTTAAAARAGRAANSTTELAVVLDDVASCRAYRPGTGPRLRPVTLLPPRDTTAYIREEFFVPHTLSHDGKKRLQYIVGWTDLPAARLVVDAERVDEYVSPLAYEEWCDARAAERDEEDRRREEEENVRAVAEAEARQRGGFVLRNSMLGRQDPDDDDERRRRRRQGDGCEGGKRKRTHDLDGPEGYERSRDPEEASGKRRPGRPRKNAPSLSTPPKALLEAFRELDDADADTEDTNEEEAIFRQLNGEQEQDLEQEEDSYDSEGESDGAPVPASLAQYPPAKKQRTSSPGPPSIVRLPPALETDSGRSTPFFDSSRRPTSSPALPSLPPPSHTTTTTTTTTMTSQHQQQQQPALPLTGSAFLPSLPQASATQTSTPSAPRTASAIQPPRRSLLSVRDPPPPPPPPPQTAAPPQPQTQTPTPKASNPPPRPPATAPPAMKNAGPPPPPPSAKRWGFGFVPLAQGLNTQTLRPWTAARAVSEATSLAPTQPVKSIEPQQQQQQHQHQHPAPSAPQPGPQPKKPSPHRRRTTATTKAATTTTTTTTTKRTTRSSSSSSSSSSSADPYRDELAPDPDDIFEVLRLEGLQIRHIRGRSVRYFAVRWRGDWPPGQNPTWEPERNIPESLVGAFLLTNPTPISPPRRGGYLSSSWVRGKYSSVSEAFGDGDAVCKVEEVDEEDRLDGDGDEVLLVTDEPRSMQPTLSW